MNPSQTSATDWLDIEILDSNGQGSVNLRDKRIQVPYTLPGDRIGWPIKDSELNIIQPSPHRIKPPCAAFGRCGGCQVQHMEHSAYLEWKQGLLSPLVDALNLSEVVKPMISMKPGSRRRVVFAASKPTGSTLFGFSARKSNQIIPIDTCLVAHREISQHIQLLRSISDPLLGQGESLRMCVILCDNGLDVSISRKMRSNPKRGKKRSQSNPGIDPNVINLALAPPIARFVVDGELVAENRRPVLNMGRAQVCPPPGGFLQASEEAEHFMAEMVVSHLQDCKTTADLFCGVGSFALPLANHSKVLAADSDKASIAALGGAWRHCGGKLKAIETQCRNLFSNPIQHSELNAFDGAVFDPPRAGAPAQTHQLARSKIKKLVAISCNPHTLLVDLNILIDAGYRVEALQPIDQFLFTPHLEIVALLRRD